MHAEGSEPSDIDPADIDPADIERVRGWIDAAERIAVLTGAGISTDSGIPDFRGPQGVWTKNPEAEKRAHISNYLADPEIRKGSWQARMRYLERTVAPNPGHLALVHLEQRGKLHTLITQNIDGLHLAAGNDPDLVVEVHGTMREVKCMDCGERAPMERALARVRAGEEDPDCRTCGGILKSATISFGEGLVADDLRRAERAAVTCDVMLAVGSTLTVYPIADVVPIAKQSGAIVVILNDAPTTYDPIADAVLRGRISEVLPALVGVDPPPS